MPVSPHKLPLEIAIPDWINIADWMQSTDTQTCFNPLHPKLNLHMCTKRSNSSFMAYVRIVDAPSTIPATVKVGVGRVIWLN